MRKKMIPFNRPTFTGEEESHVLAAMRSSKISGDGTYTNLCHKWFIERVGCAGALLTPSCTQALEMAALLIDIKLGDEVIMPSFTFVSTANAFALRGAKIIFVDIRPDTMNINERLIEDAITPKTKAIVVVHYAGVACEMDKIIKISKKYNLPVIEDAAQGMMSYYNGKPLGSIGVIGAYSFHETKNYTSGGEGGLILINDKKYVQRSEIIREKGTNRSQFFRGMVDKYSWVDIGSSYLPSELQAAYLWGQLNMADTIKKNRLSAWNTYNQELESLRVDGKIELPFIPENCEHNAHMFYIKAKNLEERTALLKHLHENEIMAVFHYIPLHTASAAAQFSEFRGADNYTTAESEKLLRLPLWYGISDDDLDRVIKAVKGFYQ